MTLLTLLPTSSSSHYTRLHPPLPPSSPSSFTTFATRSGLNLSLSLPPHHPFVRRRPSIETLGLPHPPLSTMPYATPSPSTSPTTTMTLPPPSEPIPTAATTSRPLRHHHRSHSSDAIASTSSFIFVQPASPANGTRTSSASSSSSTSSWASPFDREDSDDRQTTPTGVPIPKRRVKLFGFTPTSALNDDGTPSSQDEASAPESNEDEAATTPRQSSFHAGAPLVPVPSRTVSTPLASTSAPSLGRINSIKSAFPSRKTAMVRKKSGELVRSSLKTGDQLRRDVKPRSAPATPVCPKYVHFDTQLEHVKHFLAQQRPAAVSRSGSPVETETEDEPESFPFPAMVQAQAGTIRLKLPNFPPRVNHDQDVYVEQLDVGSDGKTIRGIVRVRNLAFEKWVAIRFTLDHWQTVSEVSAEHHESMGGNSDRFVFHIKLQDLLARIEEKTMFIAVRYTVGGREIWDNNGGQNYRVEFVKKITAGPTTNKQVAVATAAAQQHQQQQMVGTGSKRQQQQWSVVNAGQAADRMADLRRELDRLVQDDVEPSLHVNTRSFTEGSPSAFSTRYDFGNSLKMFGSNRAGGGLNSPTKPTIPLPTFESYPPSSPQPKSSPLPFLSTNPNATVYTEPSSIVNSNGSPVNVRAELPPDFGTPSFKSYPGVGLGPNPSPIPSGLVNKVSSPLYVPQSPLYASPPSHITSQRPPSPPAEAELSKLYQGYPAYHPSSEVSSSSSNGHRTRFNSVPSGSTSTSGGHDHPSRQSSLSSSSGIPAGYGPLLPPTFREHRRRDSPFASPAMSPVPSPAMSPAGGSSPARRPSPPLYPTVSPPEMQEGLWSPASTTSSTSTTTNGGGSVDSYSPLSSEGTSVPESPVQSQTLSPRPSGPLEFSSFLDRYCFHTSTRPDLTPRHSTSSTSEILSTSLGLHSPLSTTPTPTSLSTTPRASSCSSSSHHHGGYYSSSTVSASSSAPSSGASTPAREGMDGPSGTGRQLPIDGFAAFTTSATPIVS